MDTASAEKSPEKTPPDLASAGDNKEDRAKRVMSPRNVPNLPGESSNEKKEGHRTDGKEEQHRTDAKEAPLTNEQLAALLREQQKQLVYMQAQLKEAQENQAKRQEETIYHSLSSSNSVVGEQLSVAGSENICDAIRDMQNDLKSTLQEKASTGDKIHKSDIKLAKLGDVNQSNLKALLLENWLRDSKGKIDQMSDNSAELWNKIIEEVERTYNVWNDTPQLEKARIEPTPILAPEYKRIRPFIGNVVRDALTQKLRDQLLSLNLMEPEQALFYIYKICAPGGPEEVRALLKQLSDPIPEDEKKKRKYPLTFEAASKELRTWQLCLERAKHLKVSIPDASVLWAAVSLMISRVQTLDTLLQLRVDQSRLVLDIDNRPNLENVMTMHNLSLIHI